MPKLNDLTGQVFGRLTVLERAEDYVSPSGEHKPRWMCGCSCGNTTLATSHGLVCGDTQSCGCYRTEKKRAQATTHGHSSEALYSAWKGIKARCFNKNHKNYARYGGRGITLYPEWAESYEAFRAWAFTNGYVPGLTLDRIDNDGNYEPKNCRFATRVVQANNRSSNRMITYRGQTHTIKWWSDISGVPYSTLYHRVIAGWDISKALTK